MAEKDKEKQGARGWLLPALALLLGLAGVLAFSLQQEGIQPPRTAVTAAPGAAAVTRAHVTGEMKNFVLKADLPAVPELKFRNGDNAELKLSDWRGRVVLLNLWATWCGPCRREMPSLARLQSELGGEGFEVVALSVDHKGLKASAKFLKETGAEALNLYSDKTVTALQTLQVIGLPATLLIDRQGREIGRLLGPAEWDSGEAMAMIKAALGPG